MKKLIPILFMLAILLSYSQSAFARKAKTVEKKQPVIEEVFSQDELDVNKFFLKYVKCNEEHNLEELKLLYSDDFINSDDINKENFLKLIDETWKNYPDLKIDSKIASTRVLGDYATIQLVENISGTTAKKSEITNDIGVINSLSDNLIYLKKYGKNWKIYSERTLFEKTALRYGTGKNIQANIIAPEQIMSGENYTTSLKIDIPQGFLAVGSITKTPIVYPQPKTDEVFRQINPGEGVIERVLKANTTNNNELTLGSIGLTQITAGAYAKPEPVITGLVILIQRVNVIPKSVYENAK